VSNGGEATMLTVDELDDLREIVDAHCGNASERIDPARARVLQIRIREVLLSAVRKLPKLDTTGVRVERIGAPKAVRGKVN
jgi:hypothetical protein